MLLRIALVWSALFVGVQEAPTTGDEATELLERYCLAWDGDHRATWQRLEEDGFERIERDRPGESLFGVLDATLRIYAPNGADHDTRVMTGATWITSPDQGRAHYRMCWVSAPGDAEAADRRLRNTLNIASFRVVRGTRLFAWIPRPGDVNEPVSRREYFRSGQRLAREQGLRMVTIRDHEGQVFLGYASPRDEATYLGFDWSGPEPMPRP